MRELCLLCASKNALWQLILFVLRTLQASLATTVYMMLLLVLLHWVKRKKSQMGSSWSRARSTGAIVYGPGLSLPL